MSLLDRLRPQWRHSDPEVRISAVRDLGDHDQDLLLSLAQEDPDPRVRRLAIKKIANPRDLQEISDRESLASLKELAASRATEMWVGRASSIEDLDACRDALSQVAGPNDLVRVAIGASHAEIRRGALAQLSEDRNLAEIVTKASDASLREEALSRMTDASILQKIASNGIEIDMALTALEKIEDADILQAVAEERNAHKAVRLRARSKLEETIGDDHPIRQEARRQRQKELAAQAGSLIENLAGSLSSPTPRTEDALQEATRALAMLREEWEALVAKTPAEDEPREQFEEAGRALADKAERLASQKLEETRVAAELEQSLARRLELCEQVESLQEEAATTEDLERARSAWAELAAIPSAASSGQEAAETLEKRFARAVERCEERLRSQQEEQAFRLRLEELLSAAQQTAGAKLAEAEKQWPAIEKRWQEIAATFDAGAHAELAGTSRERFAAAAERLTARQKESAEKQEQTRRENLARLKTLCDRLDALAQTKELSLKEADRELRVAAERLKKLGPLPGEENRKDWKHRLSTARQRLFQRFQDQRETEEWKRWANVDIQEKLIQRLESLREESDLAVLAKDLRRVQTEWKQAGAAPRGKSEALWKRFSAVRDELRARCEVYFAENLKKKLALCERVEQLAQSTDWNRTAKTIQDLQTEWKSVGPVPLKQTKSTWRRFRKPCDEFFQKRNEHLNELKKDRLQNAKQKAELCRQAEALAESTDWEETAKELKRLQVEWKAIGPAPRKKSEALWNRFRKACDQFFDRRKRRGEVEIDGRLQQKEAACAELESIAASLASPELPSAEAVAETIRAAWEQWSGAGTVPPAKEAALRSRFQKACTDIAAVFPESLSGTPLDPRGNHKRREKMCARLEELVDLCAADQRPDSVEDVAEKLKRAFAANTIGGSPTSNRRNRKDVFQEVDRLKASWDKLGPVIDPRDRDLSDRFQKAYTDLAGYRRETANRAKKNASA